MTPGRPVFYPQGPPARDFDAEEKDMRIDIELNERLVDGIWKVLPLLIHPATAVKYGLENCEHRLLGFRDAFRDWMCLGIERELADLQMHRANPAPVYQPPKPTPEQLIAAQMNVERMEEAVAAMNDLAQKEKYAFAGPVALMRPMIEMQLDQARQHLEFIQAAMEDKPAPEVSNEPAPGEVIEPQ